MNRQASSNIERRESARVLIVEDHPLIRLGLSYSLDNHPRLVKCGEADNEAEAWGLVESVKPDAAIVDLTLTSGTGLDLIKKIARKWPNIRVVVLSMHDKSVYEKRALRAGAVAYVEKETGTDVLINELENALFRSAAKAEKNPTTFSFCEESQADDDVAKRLTDRELQVFRLIGKGMSTRQISEAQRRSIKTIESYRAKIKKKIGAITPEELTRDAVRWVFEHDAA